MRKKKALITTIIVAIAAGITGAVLGSKFQWDKTNKKFKKRA